MLQRLGLPSPLSTSRANFPGMKSRGLESPSRPKECNLAISCWAFAAAAGQAEVVERPVQAPNARSGECGVES